MKTLLQIQNEVAKERGGVWDKMNEGSKNYLWPEVCKRYATCENYALKKIIEELEDKIGTIKEMIKGDLADAIEQQEQGQDENFNSGKEEALNDVLKMFSI